MVGVTGPFVISSWPCSCNAESKHNVRNIRNTNAIRPIWVELISGAYALSGLKQETKQCKGVQKSSQVQTFQPTQIRWTLPDVFPLVVRSQPSGASRLVNSRAIYPSSPDRLPILTGPLAIFRTQ